MWAQLLKLPSELWAALVDVISSLSLLTVLGRGKRCFPSSDLQSPHPEKFLLLHRFGEHTPWILPTGLPFLMETKCMPGKDQSVVWGQQAQMRVLFYFHSV